MTYLINGTPSDLLTNDSEKTRRLKTDAQPTSFEANEQFKIFHRFNNISGTNQIVYWFSATNPVNIKERTIRLKSGKVEYLVIPDPQDGTYDAVLAQLSAAEVPVRAVNSNLADSGLTTHPVSGVTALQGTGSGLFTIGDSDQFPNGDIIGVGTQGNSALSAQIGTDPNLSGVGENIAFFLVIDPYENDTISGQFFLLWEERF